MTIGELVDYIESLAQDNPAVYDLPIDGFVIDNEVELTTQEL